MFIRMVALLKDQVLRREHAILIDDYDVRLQPVTIEGIQFQMKEGAVTGDLLNLLPSGSPCAQDDVSTFEVLVMSGVEEAQPEQDSRTLDTFASLTVAEVFGADYTTISPVLENGESQGAGKGVGVNGPFNSSHLVMPSLFPDSTFHYDALLDFPANKSLFPFQRDGVAFLIEQKTALLADEMGLGKSIQAIVAARLLFRCGIVKRCLVVSPKSVLSDWASKFEEWANELTISTISGTKSARTNLWVRPAHVYLVTYETLREDILTGVETQMIRSNFDLIILDEIQKIKNSSTKTYRAIRQIEGARRWGLSGTPLENRVEELTTIFSYLKPGLFDNVEVNDPTLVRTVVTPFVLRRTKSAVLSGLPEKIHDRVLLDLDPKQRATYDRIERDGVIYLKERGRKVTVTHIMALISKLKQICNIEPVSGESCKLDYLEDVLTNLTETEDKMMVFSQYPEKTLKQIAPRLRRFHPLIYHGSLTGSQRDAVLKTFEEDEHVRVILISLKAGALGLTLTAANYVTHFDSWWNPAVMSQAEDRAHRIGQKKTVFVTTLITQNTVEERIQRILEEKRFLFKEVVGELSNYRLTSAMTENELFGLFGLRRSDRKAS